jgi:MFS family permease
MASLFTRSFVALLATQACFGFSFSSFFLLPTFMTRELAAGPDDIGRVTACFYVTAVSLGPWMGSVVDRRGRRRFLTAGALLMAVVSLGFVAVDGMGPLIYALRALQGVAFAMAFVAGSALAVDEAPPERLALALGIFGLTMLSNNAIAPVAVEEIARHAGWAPAFVAASAAALVSAALSLRIRERVRAEPEAPIPRLLDVMRRPGAARVGLVIALAGAAFGTMFTFPQPFALELGMDRVRSFFVAYTAAALVARLGLGPFTDHLGRRPVSLVALLFYPTFNALAVQDTGERERGKAMALFNGAFNVGYASGVFALGLLAESVGYPPVFRVGAACAAGAFAVLWLSGRRRRSARASPASAA